MLFSKNVFAILIAKFSLQKMMKTLSLEELNNLWTENFSKKTFSSFWKPFLTKMETGKYAGAGSSRSFLISVLKNVSNTEVFNLFAKTFVTKLMQRVWTKLLEVPGQKN